MPSDTQPQTQLFCKLTIYHKHTTPRAEATELGTERRLQTLLYALVASIHLYHLGLETSRGGARRATID